MKRYIQADIVDFEDEDWSTLYAMACDPNTSTRTLTKLAKDPNFMIQVANNHSVPGCVISGIAQEAIELYRRGANPARLFDAIVDNPSTPLDVLEFIIPYCDFRTLRSMVFRPDVTYDLLYKLSKSRNCPSDVRAQARGRIKEIQRNS